MKTLKQFSTTALAATLLMLCSATSALAQGTLTSDKQDYAPGETVTFTGAGFSPGEAVAMRVLHTDTSLDNDASAAHQAWQVIADPGGNFQATWIVPLAEDELGALLQALADGQSSGVHAEAFFWDATNWTLTISPATSVVADTQTYVLTAANTSSGGGNQIGCMKDTIPSAFTPVGSPSIVSVSGGHAWTISRSGQIISLTANSSGDRIGSGDTIRFSQKAVAPAGTSGSPFRWGGNAVANTNCTGASFPVPSSGQPTVSVICTSPEVTTNPISQTTCAGGNVSFDASATGRPTPTLQWQVSTDGGTTFSNIGGATSSPLTFTASGSQDGNKYRAVFTNSCGTANSPAATLTVHTAPKITPPANITVGNDAGECGARVNFSASATGNPVPAITYSQTPGTIFPIGTTTVKAIATNSCGSDSCTFTVTVNDAEKPKITCPSNIATSTDPGQCSAVVNYAVRATDNCPGVTVVTTPASGSVFSKGTTTVHSIATDAAGNKDSCSFTVTVDDHEKPKITCPADMVVSTDPGQCSAVVNYSIQATDNCPGVTVITTPASGSTFSKGITTVRSIATDAAGNKDSCSFTVTVNDNEKPTISGPANITTNNDPGACGANVNYATPVGTDNCPGATTVQTAGLASGSQFPKGTTTNTFVVTDAAGNKDSCSFTVTVNDAEKPAIVCPGNIETSTDPGQCSAVVNYAVRATDNCPGVTVITTPASGSTFSKGTTTVYSVATDAAGNKDSCSFTVTVHDNEKPAIVCPANIVTSTDPGQCSAVVNYTVLATDNCPGVTVVTTPVSGSVFSKGTTTVHSVATDAAGNKDSCSFTVTVNDNEKPTIACAGNKTAGTDPHGCTAVIHGIGPVSSSDNCPGATIQYTLSGATAGTGANDASGTAFNKGMTTVTYTITDDSGNKDSCSFTVTVSDNEKPTISGPANITTNNDPGACGANVTYTTPVGTDNCPGATTVQTAGLASGSQFPKGTTTNTFVVTDAAGNKDSCSFTVTVIDNTPPVIANCPANVTVYTGPGRTSCDQAATWTAPTATDNCALKSFTSNYMPGAIFPKGSTSVTYTATDSANNTATCSFTVTVVDNTPPVLACPPNITTSTYPGLCSAVVNYTVLATDNCQGVTVVSTPASGSTFSKGTTTVYSVATDAAGNKDSCSFTVTVNDNEKPAVICPANIVTLVDSANCSATVNFQVAATDNCPGVTVTATPASGSVFPKGVTPVLCVATDAAGNKDSCSFTVTVNNPAPVATISAPASGSIYAAGTPVTFSGSFIDNSGIHTGVWRFDALSTAGTVDEATGSVTGTYTFSTAGVYSVKLIVKDQCSDSCVAIQAGGFNAMIVIYDPNAGFVTGGGWITSPPGAYRQDTTLTGKANFGFVSKYQKGQSIPTGETEFQFQVASLNFHSTTYEWLTIAGAKAQYKGSGTINNAGNYGFMLTAIDGNINGGGGIDKFRMKIVNKATGALVYDNQFGSADSSTPTTSLGGGSIVIHSTSKGAIAGKGGAPVELSGAALPKEYQLQQNYPNPFNPSTRFDYALPDEGFVTLKIYNVLGAEVVTVVNEYQPAGFKSISFNAGSLPSGIYFYRLSATGGYGDKAVQFTDVKKMVVMK